MSSSHTVVVTLPKFGLMDERQVLTPPQMRKRVLSFIAQDICDDEGEAYYKDPTIVVTVDGLEVKAPEED